MPLFSDADGSRTVSTEVKVNGVPVSAQATQKLTPKGDDWKGTEKGNALEARFAEVGVAVHYFPDTEHTSSTKLSSKKCSYHKVTILE